MVNAIDCKSFKGGSIPPLVYIIFNNIGDSIYYYFKIGCYSLMVEYLFVEQRGVGSNPINNLFIYF